MPEHKQASPLTVPVLRQLASAVATAIDFVLLLSLVAAIFCVARQNRQNILRHGRHVGYSTGQYPPVVRAEPLPQTPLASCIHPECLRTELTQCRA